MSFLLIELEPSEKIYLELNEPITLKYLISKINNFIKNIHIYQNNDYYLINVLTYSKNINLTKNTKIILENGDDPAKILLDFNVSVKEVSMIDECKKEEIIKELLDWNAKSIKTINIPNEKQSNLIKNFSKFGDNLLTLIEECSSNSTTGNITFRFFFMDGKEFLQLFHYQMFLILKKFVENLIISHSNFKDSHYVIDIFVFVSEMNIKELGSAMIHKYVKNDESELILPTKAIMRVNKKFLTKDKKNIINIKLIQTLFHELLHCLGFGYWDLFKKNITTLLYKQNVSNDEFIIPNVIIYDKIINVYRSIFKDDKLCGVPLTEDNSHYNTYNTPVLKNGKLFGVLPGLKYELMSNNDTNINVFSKLSASVIESLGYKINYYLCDEYPFTPMTQNTEIEYGKPTNNHFANGFEKYIIILKYGDISVSGIEIFSMKENTEYKIINNHSYQIFCVSNLEENEEYLLGKKEGIEYNNNNITIIPNSKTPNIFYIVSSITFGGIPIIKIPSNDTVNYTNCYNNNSLKKIVEEFMDM